MTGNQQPHPDGQTEACCRQQQQKQALLHCALQLLRFTLRCSRPMMSAAASAASVLALTSGA
jgi:hypothetical protein